MRTMPLSERASARLRLLLTISLLTNLSIVTAFAQDKDRGKDDEHEHFTKGNLVVSRSVYDNNAGNVTVGQPLPPNCAPANCVMATNNGLYPLVFNNNLIDGSFGITSRILLDQVDPRTGRLINTLEVPNGENHLVTSFSSKSELALNLSTDGERLTFMGYVAPLDAIDVSNSNTPGVVDPTNPVALSYFRAVAAVDKHGRFNITETNAYSGNNGRAAVLVNNNGANFYYLAGNAGNGSNPQPDDVIIAAGAQFLTPATGDEDDQSPGLPTPLGSFNITQLGKKADKIGKDTNFRGLTIFNNVVYFTKGSGGNGVNTVYFVDTSGQACPSGVGVPAPGASLPTAPLMYDPTHATIQAKGLFPYNMCVLNGFPSDPKTSTAVFFPFGVWFADANTLYVAQEGNGDSTFDPVAGKYTAAAAQTIAGLQKWTFNGTTWTLAYTLSAGLELGAPYTIAGYPSGNNTATGKPWAPATDGIRNITGHVNHDGTVTIYAVTSTVSGSGDQGADPNKVLAITDKVSATSLPSGESFTSLRTAASGEVLRGVSFTPESNEGEGSKRN